jgi:hypothetical protein
MAITKMAITISVIGGINFGRAVGVRIAASSIVTRDQNIVETVKSEILI